MRLLAVHLSLFLLQFFQYSCRIQFLILCRDIDKRILVSKFSAPGTSVFHCVPVGMFRWQSKGKHNSKDLTDEIMNATKMWFSGMGENQILPVQNKDMAVWLLISTPSDTDSQCCQSSSGGEANLARCWRLALLAKNMVIMGRTLDSGYFQIFL